MPIRKLWLVAGLLAFAAGCEQRSPTSAPATSSSSPAGGEVIVYTALDRQFSEPILDEFTAQTGIRALAVYDTESTKTVGLTNRIRAEAKRPRCDVFWNNEILNTLRLKTEGLLQPCRPANAEHYPPRFRDPAGYWYGFAARARVLIVNTDLVPASEWPTSIRDLADPRWKGRAGIAKPLFGSTASHAAVLFAYLGANPAQELFTSYSRNDIQVVAGNKACADMVAEGALALGLTDTDDAVEERDAGKPVAIVFPDAGPGEMGTLLLPNTLALVAGCPHPAAGQQLIDFLLSADVEQRLAAGPSAQIPLNEGVKGGSRVAELSALHPLPVDFEQAAVAFEAAASYIEKEFLAR
jgi:iron(III) transport system substrate-binding protein